MASALKVGSPSMSNATAWRLAVERTRGRAAQRAAHPTGALLPALQAWIGWSFSSSGVEQDFSTVRGLLTPQGRESAADWYVADLLSICAPSSGGNDVRQARIIWADFFGRSRQGRAESARIDKGVKRPVRDPGTGRMAGQAAAKH